MDQPYLKSNIKKTWIVVIFALIKSVQDIIEAIIQGANNGWQNIFIYISLDLAVFFTGLFIIQRKHSMKQQLLLKIAISLNGIIMTQWVYDLEKYRIPNLIVFAANQQMFKDLLTDNGTQRKFIVISNSMSMIALIFSVINHPNQWINMIPVILFLFIRDHNHFMLQYRLSMVNILYHQSRTSVSKSFGNLNKINSQSGFIEYIEKGSDYDYILDERRSSMRVSNKTSIQRRISLVDQNRTYPEQNCYDMLPIGIVIIKSNKYLEFINKYIITLLTTDEKHLSSPQMTFEYLMKKIKFKIIKKEIWESKFVNKSTDINDIYDLQSISQINIEKSKEDDKLYTQSSLGYILNLFQKGILQKYLVNGNLELQGSFDQKNFHTYGESIINISVNLYPLHDPDDCILLIINDITKQNEFLDLKIKERFKNRVIKSFSHELRTPLNAAQNYLNAFLQDDSLNQQQKTIYIKPALQSLKIQGYLIHDIIDFCQMNSQLINLNIKDVKIQDIVDEIINIFEPFLIDKKLKFLVDISKNSPLNFQNDFQRICQVLVNIIQNSIKFSTQGTITLKIDVNRIDLIRFTVVDQGCGIEKRKLLGLQNTLDHFDWNDHIENVDDWDGFGLLVSQMILLSLSERTTKIKIDSLGSNMGTQVQFLVKDFPLFCGSQKILDSMQQDVRSRNKSQPNMRLYQSDVLNSINSPIQQSKEDDLYLQSPDHDEEQLLWQLQPPSPKKRTLKSLNDRFTKSRMKCSCTRILSVDDEMFNQQSLRLILSKIGHEVYSCYNGLEAIEFIDQVIVKWEKCNLNCRFFLIILMDFQMPIMDGCQTTKHLRKMMSENKLPFIPIIGLTAFTSKLDQDLCIQAGMNQIINKPLKIVELKKILSKLPQK